MSERDGEVDRIKRVYADRDAAGHRARYRWTAPGVLVTEYGKRQAMARLLHAGGYADLGGVKVLDVGCGDGTWLAALQGWGAAPSDLHGTELLPDRREEALGRLPGADVRLVEGWALPWPDHAFDLVLSFTVFSSILDPHARVELAGEMARVLSPRGAILVYDFRVKSPRNPDVHPVGRRELKRLWPGSRMSVRKVTLAPPLTRFLSRLAPELVPAMELVLPPLRTHLMSLIWPDR